MFIDLDFCALFSWFVFIAFQLVPEVNSIPAENFKSSQKKRTQKLHQNNNFLWPLLQKKLFNNIPNENEYFQVVVTFSMMIGNRAFKLDFSTVKLPLQQQQQK